MGGVDIFATVERERQSFLRHELHSLGLPSLFYGSLRAPEVFEVVVGRPMSEAMVESVILPDHELARIIAGDGLPGIFPTRHACDLHCLLIDGLTPYESLRVAWFEWDEYKLDRFILKDGREAQAFVPDQVAIRRLHGMVDVQPWSYEDWRAGFLADATLTARAWMAEMPDLSAKLAAAE